MRQLIFAVMLIASPTYAQEAWLDEVEVEVETPEVYVDPVLTELDAIKSELENLKQAIAAVKMPMPAETCQCDCDCPTADEIRQIVREELQAVIVELRTAKGDSKTVAMPLTTPSKPNVMQLQPGDTVVAIDGQPVTPFKYQSQSYQAPVTQYTTPRYEMRVLNGVYGAVRQQTCRMVNGVKVCN